MVTHVHYNFVDLRLEFDLVTDRRSKIENKYISSLRLYFSSISIPDHSSVDLLVFVCKNNASMYVDAYLSTVQDVYVRDLNLVLTWYIMCPGEGASAPFSIFTEFLGKRCSRF